MYRELFIAAAAAALLCTCCDAVILCRNAVPETRVDCIVEWSSIAVDVRTHLVSLPTTTLPLLIRLAWHSSATYNGALNPQGGTIGGCIKQSPERDLPVNRGLDKAVQVVLTLFNAHPTVTFADLGQLSAAVAFELLGSHRMYFTPGREDYHSLQAKTRCSRTDRTFTARPLDDFPFTTSSRKLLEKFTLYFNGYPDIQVAQYADGGYDPQFVRLAVALMGGHTVGGCSTEVSGFDSNFTTTPYRFDNAYFTGLLARAWQADGASYPFVNDTERQMPAFDAGGGRKLLAWDLALVARADTRAAVEAFAQNNTLFLATFALAWERVVENGMQASLVDSWRTTTALSPILKRFSDFPVRSKPAISYTCERDLQVAGPRLVIHSKAEPSSFVATPQLIHVAIRNSVPGGWMAVSFPRSGGSMYPAPFAIGHGAKGVQFFAIDARSPQGIRLLRPDEMWSSIENVMYESLGGMQILSFTWRRPPPEADANASVPSFDPRFATMNVARNPESNVMEGHPITHASSFTLDLTTGKERQSYLSGRELMRWRALHGFLMTAATLFVLPAGILAKRYGKRVFQVSDASSRHIGAAFALHIVFQTVGVFLVVSGYYIAATKMHTPDSWENNAAYYHRSAGLPAVLLLCITWSFGALTQSQRVERQLVVIVGKKPIRVAHAVLGSTTVLLLGVQCLTGLRRMVDLHQGETDADNMLVTVYAGVTFLCTSVLVLEFARRRRRCYGQSLAKADNLVEEQLSSLPLYSMREVAVHAAADDLWVAVEGKVVDATRFLNEHPGGSAMLLAHAGSDATAAFHAAGHSASAVQVLCGMVVGRVEGAEEAAVAAELVSAFTTLLCARETAAAAALLRSEAASHAPRTLLLQLHGLVETVSTNAAATPLPVAGTGDASAPSAAAAAADSCEASSAAAAAERLRVLRRALEDTEPSALLAGDSKEAAPGPPPLVPPPPPPPPPPPAVAAVAAAAAAAAAAVSPAVPPLPFPLAAAAAAAAAEPVEWTLPHGGGAEHTVVVLSVRRPHGDAGAAAEGLLAAVAAQAERTRGVVHRVAEDAVTVAWGAFLGGGAAGGCSEAAACRGALAAAAALATDGYRCGGARGRAVCGFVEQPVRSFQLQGGVVRNADLLSRLACSSRAACVMTASVFAVLRQHARHVAHAPFFDVASAAGQRPLSTRVVLSVRPGGHGGGGGCGGSVSGDSGSSDDEPSLDAGVALLRSQLRKLFQGCSVRSVLSVLEASDASTGFPDGPAFLQWLVGLLRKESRVPVLDVAVSGAVYGVPPQGVPVRSRRSVPAATSAPTVAATATATASSSSASVGATDVALQFSDDGTGSSA